MLSRSVKLSAEQFKPVMEKGRVSHSSLFLLRTLSGGDHTRVAAVVPVKVAKTAVQRNKFRRKIYEAVRLLYPSLKSGTHSIVFAKPALLKATQVQIASDVKELFVKSGLLG